MQNRTFYLLLLILAIAGTSVRLAYIFRFNGFYEPDGWYHYSIVLQSIKDGSIPKVSALDNITILEPQGLYELVLTPYYLLGGIVSPLLIMQLLPVVFFLLTFVVFLFFIKEIYNNKLFILFAALILAFSIANISRSFATSFRGDDFAAFFLILGLLLFLKAIRAGNHRTRFLYVFLAGVILATTRYVWNGSSFVTIILVIAYVLLLSFGHLFKDKKLIQSSYVIALLFVPYTIIIALLVHFGLIAKVVFTPETLSVITMGMLLISAVQPILIKKFGISSKLASVVVIFIISLALLMILADDTLLPAVLSISGTYQNQIGIQELSPPTPSFIFSQFTTQAYMTPMVMSFLLISYLNRNFLSFFIMCAFIPLYIWLWRKNPNVNGIPFLLCIAYFITTSLLASNVIRFMALFSIPVAILSSFTLSVISDKIKNKKAVAIGISALFGLLIVFTIVNIPLQVQADNINPQFFQALNWIKNNTSTNATFLSEWSDGSLIEGYANRFSYSDSVGGLNVTYNNMLTDIVFSNATLNSSDFISLHSPKYLLFRSFWLNESPDIFVEASMNLTNYLWQGRLNDSNYEKLIAGCQGCIGIKEVYNNSQNLVFELNYSAIT